MPALSRLRHRAGRRYSAEEVIDAVYRGLLDRPAEPRGIATHGQLLRDGVGLDAVVYGIGHSREYFETWLRAGDLPALAAEAWQAASRHRHEPPVYFLHIMKTGGTSLIEALGLLAEDRFCLTQIFLDHLVTLPRVVLDSASLVSGHLGIEARDLLPANTVTATVLRDPLERTLSHYAHVRADPALKSETAGLSLEEFVHSPRWRPFGQNFQARSLVHRVGLADVWRRHSPAEMLADLDPDLRPRSVRLPLQTVFELGPLDRTDDELRREAMGNLASIEHVGVSDLLDSTYTELTRIWGVENPPALERLNVSPARPSAADVAPRLREEILAANAVDLVLYEEARERAAASAAAPAGRVVLPLVPRAAAPVQEPVTTPAAAMVEPAVRRRAHPLPPGPVPRWGLILGLVLSAVVAGFDLVLSQSIVLIDLLVVGPCCAIFTTRWRVTAAVGAGALVGANLLALSDGIWDTITQLTALIAIAVVSLTATAAAVALERARARPVAATFRPTSA